MRWIAGLLLLMPVLAQEVHGPMVGYGEITETALWLQTQGTGQVQIRFWPQGDPQTARLTPPVTTQPEQDFIARFTLTDLKMGSRYDYEIYLNGTRLQRPYPMTFNTQPLWQFRTDPPNFSFAFGSCSYINDPPYDRPGKPYGGDPSIFTTIARQKPDFMLWLGDNVYFRESDWTSEAGMRYRYRHDRRVPELQPLLASTHHYAIWDDHDYGPNDSDRTFRGQDLALKVFRDYWANPSYGTPSTPGVFSRFVWGDVEFFLLDDRFYRSPNNLAPGPSKAMFGPAQMSWLTESLRSSQATFKIIVNGNQLLNPLTFFEAWGKFPDEQKSFLSFLTTQKIPGVLFLSGDRHHSELLKRQEPGLYPLYEFTASPLTAGGSRLAQEADNPSRVPGTWVTEGTQNFGLIQVSGPLKSRTLTLKALDKTGKELWKYQIPAAQLQL